MLDEPCIIDVYRLYLLQVSMYIDMFYTSIPEFFYQLGYLAGCHIPQFLHNHSVFTKCSDDISLPPLHRNHSYKYRGNRVMHPPQFPYQINIECCWMFLAAASCTMAPCVERRGDCQLLVTSM